MVNNVLRASAYDSMTDELGDLEATIVTSSINFYGENNIDIQPSGKTSTKRKHEGNPRTLSLLGKGLKTPGTETFRWGGNPPPPGPPRTRFCRKVSGKKLTEKGGTPPPRTIHYRKRKFFRRKQHFLPKKHCFWANFYGFFS